MRSRARRATIAASIGLLAAGVVLVGSPGSPPVRESHGILRLVPQSRTEPVGRFSSPPSDAQCLAQSKNTEYCYDPAQLRDAYDLGPLYAKGLRGHGQTIVIVDPFGSPTIRHDLAVFDAAFGINAPPSFRIIEPAGPVSPYRATAVDRSGWAGETTLDVEWSHALAPDAAILLVDTPTDEVEGTSGFPDIVRAENDVIAHHEGGVISQSFGATETTFTGLAQIAQLRSADIAARVARVSVLGATGDFGVSAPLAGGANPPLSRTRVIGWPSSDPLVTGLGGTALHLNENGSRRAADVAWNDTYAQKPPSPSASSGGVSIYFARPSFQNSVRRVVGVHRGNPDISMSAACTAGVDIYESYPPASQAGWQVSCGTSESTPLFAAVVAIADEFAGHWLGDLNPALYALASRPHNGLVAVTSGNNTVTWRSAHGALVTVKGYDAHAGYNLVTGLGTIDAARFVPALVAESLRLAR